MNKRWKTLSIKWLCDDWVVSNQQGIFNLGILECSYAEVTELKVKNNHNTGHANQDYLNYV